MSIGQNKKENNYICYIIKNIINGKVYVGVTSKTIDERFKEHLKVSRFKNSSKKQAIHHAICKYGKENFTISILSEFENEAGAFQAEIAYIKQYNSNSIKHGYNETTGGDCGPRKIKHDSNVIISILNDYCNNIKLRELSVKYGLSYSAIFDITRLRISKEHNIPDWLISALENFKKISPKRKKVNKEIVIKIISLFVDDNKTMQQIADECDLSLNNVWNILHLNTFKNLLIEKELLDKLNLKLSKTMYWKKLNGSIK